MIKILFFAALRERLDCEETTEQDFTGTAAMLLEQLKARSAHWARTLDNQEVLCAVNQELVPLTQPVQDGDEVAFFPPVTGG